MKQPSHNDRAHSQAALDHLLQTVRGKWPEVSAIFRDVQGGPCMYFGGCGGWELMAAMYSVDERRYVVERADYLWIDTDDVPFSWDETCVFQSANEFLEMESSWIIPFLNYAHRDACYRRRELNDPGWDLYRSSIAAFRQFKVMPDFIVEMFLPRFRNPARHERLD